MSCTSCGTTVRNATVAEAAASPAELFRASRNAEFAATDPTLEDLLGRDATPLRSLLETVVSSKAAASA